MENAPQPALPVPRWMWPAGAVLASFSVYVLFARALPLASQIRSHPPQCESSVFMSTHTRWPGCAHQSAHELGRSGGQRHCAAVSHTPPFGGEHPPAVRPVGMHTTPPSRHSLRPGLWHGVIA